MAFSEGNVFVQINENVQGLDVFVVQSVQKPVNDNFMKLLFWIDALKRASAQQVKAVIPFLSYARGDKNDEPRVSVRSHVFADALQAAGCDGVLTMDLHSAQIQGFFRISVDHQLGPGVICDKIQELKISDLVFAVLTSASQRTPVNSEKYSSAQPSSVRKFGLTTRKP